MEYLFLGGILLFLYICALLFGKREENKRKKRFLKHLEETYGKRQTQEFSESRTKAEKGYFERHRDEDFYLDDITWNDLEMEEIYHAVNYCYSSAGDEYLYYRLRVPKLEEDAEEIKREEDAIDFLHQNTKERIRIQMLFTKMGRTGKFSIYQYLDYLSQLQQVSLFRYYLGAAIYVILIVCIFFSAPLGLIGLAVYSIWNILTYMKKKREIEPYFVSFKYILRILKTTELLAKDTPEVWQDEITLLKELRSKIRSVSASSLWLIDESSNLSASGDITLMFLAYIKMITHLDIYVFYKMLRQVMQKTEEIDQIIGILGKLESQISISSYRASLPNYAKPQFDNPQGMQMEGAYHPLLTQPVPNSFDVKKSMLLTGSNASGKSTFLKTVAVNAVLAQSIRTVAAASYHGAYFRIFSSMALRDNMLNGESYYMVEIRSLKRIMDAAFDGESKVLCFVDEVLRGTNTVERIAASTQIMRGLALNPNTMVFAATHDIELTELLKDSYDNYHFEEEIAENDIIFRYELLEGKAKTRNAIRLLSMLGYQPEVIRDANEMAKIFMETGEWKNVEGRN